MEFNFNFEESPHLLKILMHTTLTNFLRFQKIADTINEGTFTISNYEYYKEQATFVNFIVGINKIKWDSYGNECI